MRKTIISLVLVPALAIMALACVRKNPTDGPSGPMMSKTEQSEPAENAMMKNDASDTTMAQKDFYDLSAMKPFVLPYAGEADAWMAAEKGTTVYFFAATWCPTCKEAYENIRVNYAGFPMGFSLIVANYDTETTLKQKYGVAYQHTFVMIDKKGKALKTWSGSKTVAEILAASQGM